ncbi:MAG: iron-sulfur cluster-binding domain-containing protein [Erysipelotrichaceae bacterium]|nr:iron-sulfur cluster-binding domain-containing protein [Erysipelotrichaceae bacterium]
MASPKLWKLNPMDFTKMTPARNEVIEKAEAKPLPPTNSYVPNQIANALHPGVQHLKVNKIVENENAKTYYLEANAEKGTKSLAYFSAGQYLSIELEIGKMKLNRPYSLASSPKEALAGTYMLTIKRVDGGLASNYILDNWAVGTEVTASEPLGTFTYEPLRDAKTVIGLAGGSGITPFRSLAKAIVDGDEDAELVLLYGTNTLKEAIFQEEFKELQKLSPKFKLVNVLSAEDMDGVEKGFITAELIKKYAPEQYSIFMCGPQAMVNFVDKEIEKLNLRKKFVRHELSGEYFNPDKEEDYPTNVNPTFNITVRIAGKEQTIVANANDSILRSLEKNGIKSPAHCRSGECGWCHSHLISGEIYAPKSVDGRREADLIYGYIHPCCSFPLSDLVIEVPPTKK